MCFFQSPLFLPTLLLVVSSPFIALFLYRTIARLILKPVWTFWYVRRAVDASFVGLLALSFVCFVSHKESHFTPEQRATGDNIYQLRDFTFNSHSRYYPASEKLYQDYWSLNTLMDFQWFLQNFGRFVFLPAFSVLSIGYALQRSQEEKLRSSTREVSTAESTHGIER